MQSELPAHQSVDVILKWVKTISGDMLDCVSRYSAHTRPVVRQAASLFSSIFSAHKCCQIARISASSTDATIREVHARFGLIQPDWDPWWLNHGNPRVIQEGFTRKRQINLMWPAATGVNKSSYTALKTDSDQHIHTKLFVQDFEQMTNDNMFEETTSLYDMLMHRPTVTIMVFLYPYLPSHS